MQYQRSISAAKLAGAVRIVHVSVTNPSADFNLEYFSSKEDVLIDNIAWAMLLPA
jgi:hypothetical protein